MSSKKIILPILYTVATLDALSFPMIFTVLDPYILKLGGTQFLLGVLGSVCALVTLIWNPIVGSLSDIIGRKEMLLQCLFIGIVSNLFMTFSSSLITVFAARLLAALGSQIMTLIKSLVDDSIESKDDKTRAFGRIQAIGGISFIVGALLSGVISESENGANRVYAIVSILFVTNFMLIALLKKIDNAAKPKDSKQEKPQSEGILKEFKKAITNLTNINWPKFWDLFTIKIITDLTMSIFHFGLMLTLSTKYGLSGKSLGYVFAIMSLVGITTGLTISKLKSHFYKSDKSGLTRVLHGSILLALSYFFQPLATNITFYLIALVPLMVARVLLENTMTEMVLARASPEEKGSVMGAFDTTMALGGLVGPILSGVLMQIFGNNAGCFFCSALVMVGISITYLEKAKID